MPRNARAVAVGYPHHVTQRGNNREPVFFDDGDRWAYLELLDYYTQKYQVNLWAYCLMTNHIHLLVVPHRAESLSRGIGLTNLTYTQHVNRKYQRCGRIWQNRFFSAIVETNRYLWAVARYVENNPVAAGLVAAAEDFPWSSARHHILDKPDPLLEGSSWLNSAERKAYHDFLRKEDKRMTTMINQATRSGRAI